MTSTLEALSRRRGRPEWVVEGWDAFIAERCHHHGGTFPGYVYFIQAGKRGPIKIGYSEKHPNDRLRDLQTGNHKQLYLLGYCAADRRVECRLHEWFEDWRTQGEWFRPGTFGLPELIAHINARLPI